MIVRASLVATAVLLVAGCAGGDGGGAAGLDGRPSAAVLAAAIRSGESGLGVGDSAADCVAQVLFESDLSDDALRRYTGENDAETLDDAAFSAFLDEAEDTCGISRGGG